jgi:hypothetical protein
VFEMREETLGRKLLDRRSELGTEFAYNLARIAMLEKENEQLKSEMVRGLVEAEGCDRRVWGTAIMTPSLTEDTATVEGKVLHIVKAGLATPDERERFKLFAVVQGVEVVDDLRLVRYFDPFQDKFDIQPIELGDSLAPA